MQACDRAVGNLRCFLARPARAGDDRLYLRADYELTDELPMVAFATGQFVLIDHDISRLVTGVGERMIRLNEPLYRDVAQGAEVVRLRQDQWQAQGAPCGTVTLFSRVGAQSHRGEGTTQR